MTRGPIIHGRASPIHMVSQDVPRDTERYPAAKALAKRVGRQRFAIVSRVLIPRETVEEMERSTGLVFHFYALARDGPTIWLFPEGGRDYLRISDALRRGDPWRA